MADLSFQDLRFRHNNGKVVVEFLGNYQFEVDDKALSNISRYELDKDGGNSIRFADIDEETARGRFNAVLDYGLTNLTNTTTGKKTLYVHRFSRIPLIGTTNFGIIDRNTNMIEVRPLTGCNMNCIFCSVDEGLTSKKTSEVVIEEDYLVTEVKKLVEFKGCECNIIINSQGEPTLYKPLAELIRDLKAVAQIKTITLITNGTLLNEKLIDELADAGLTTMNVSLNAVDPKIARVMEGHGLYDVVKAKKMAAYAAKTKIKVCLAPVIVGGYNEGEMEKIVQFAKEIGATTAMQNYLYYKLGRNPRDAEQLQWPTFYKKLEELEKEYGSKLIFSAADYSIIKTKPLPKPYRKGQVAKATIIAEGRYPREYIAAANPAAAGFLGGEPRIVGCCRHLHGRQLPTCADGRIITLPDCEKSYSSGEKIKIKIVSDKHNIFYGKVV
ncbi:radical SAM protein [Candidatus Woesearchaeota archaeon]|nr:radical SAM protein [Candidatus Woesearchaeota archaeon]